MSNLYGNGQIAVHGAVLDSDLVFDATHAATQNIAFGSGGTLNLSIDGTGDLGAGYNGSGSLRIADGLTVTSAYGYLGGFKAGSAGTATITGPGSRWTTSARLSVGSWGAGTLNLESGGQITSAGALIGGAAGAIGTVTVSGAGSTWTNTGDFIVGNSGHGVLNIEAGGQVVTSSSYLGYESGSLGTATVSGTGSRWAMSGSSLSAIYVGYGGEGSLTVSDGGLVTAETLFGSLSDLHGNGTISVGGVVLDDDLVFDATHGATQTLAFGTGGTLEIAFIGARLGAGYKRNGSLTITDGVTVRSGSAYLGHEFGSTGTATVRGAGSALAPSGALRVGFGGRGTLIVEQGGQISSGSASLGYNQGSTGTVTVRGAGSKWANSQTLTVGSPVGNTPGSSGSLTVADGGLVTAQSLSIKIQSRVNLHVSGNSMVMLGSASTSGSMTNNGTVGLYADALLPAGVYQPIAAFPGRTISWSGTGTYTATGGTWNSTDKTFIVSAPTLLAAGALDTVASGERSLITDSGSGKRMGASFGTVSGGIEFSAAPMGDSAVGDLLAVLGAGGEVLGAWDFVTNFSGGGEVLLSFDIGVGADDLAVWRLRDGAWSAYAPSLLSYDSRGLVSFTVDSFSGYAVAMAVPEPGGLAVLAAVCALVGLRRRANGAVHHGWRSAN